MKSFLPLFVFAAVIIAGNGRLIFADRDSIGDDNPLDDVIYDAEDDDVSFDVENRDDVNVFPYFDDQLVEDSSDSLAEDDVFVGNELTGCHNGKCETCMKMWKLKACFVAEITSEGIKLSFKAYGKSISHVIKSNGSFTLRMKKSKLPKSMRKLMKSDLEIRISGIDIARKQLCVQLKVKVKFFGTIKWPKRSPQCFKL
ncbi:uncharacterized protein LOC132717163 [Ruditapes philippinarum]|uniref:uncharacterized protein LOC132717163 n=1 Tax=Ruditapes philippinarum TaxID=129788 RepID=UPI00295B54AA|nr:uncharacterized protein LOC132717163 [Ruditapes philippinarum]